MLKQKFADKNYSNVALMGLFFAMSMVLSYVEMLLPPLPQGIKFGLSNIVTMYALLFLGKKEAIVLTTLKSLFVLLTRGVIASLMSISGGIFSICIMILLLQLKKYKPSYLIISICGAVAHNIGQLVMSMFIINSNFIIYYLPIMVVSGVIMGSLTGITLRLLLPYIKNIAKK